MGGDSQVASGLVELAAGSRGSRAHCGSEALHGASGYRFLQRCQPLCALISSTQDLTHASCIPRPMLPTRPPVTRTRDACASPRPGPAPKGGAPTVNAPRPLPPPLLPRPCRPARPFPSPLMVSINGRPHAPGVQHICTRLHTKCRTPGVRGRNASAHSIKRVPIPSYPAILPSRPSLALDSLHARATEPLAAA
jgi:hypothetical protein